LKKKKPVKYAQSSCSGQVNSFQCSQFRDSQKQHEPLAYTVVRRQTVLIKSNL